MVSAKFPVKHIPMAPTPRPPALPVGEARERAQPLRHRARLAGRERAELGTDAGLLEDRDAFLGARHGAVAAEQRGHVDRKSGVSHPAGEARDLRADSRHLAHDDDRRSAAGDVHPPGHAVERDLAWREILQRIVLLHAARQHGCTI